MGRVRDGCVCVWRRKRTKQRVDHSHRRCAGEKRRKQEVEGGPPPLATRATPGAASVAADHKKALSLSLSLRRPMASAAALAGEVAAAIIGGQPLAHAEERLGALLPGVASLRCGRAMT